MSTFEWLLIAFGTVFVINVVPAFMPSTWMVVAFFAIAYHLPFWPLCFGAAVAATAGRCALALLSKRWGRKLLSAKQRQNVTVLGDWLNKKTAWGQFVAVLIYSLGPIPSNLMFIAGGLSNLRLGPMAAGFFVGRLVSYPLFAGGAKGISDHFGDLFLKDWKDPKYIALELLSLVGIILFAHIDWPRVLHLSVPSVKGDGGGTPNESSSSTTSAVSRPPKSF